MKSKIIYVLRHGETDLNKQGMVQGRGVNTSLNDTGRMQAEMAYRGFRDKEIDLIATSSLNRSQETVELYRQDGIPIISLAGFDEISWGNQEGKVASMEAKNLYSDTVTGWKNGNLLLNVGGGENPIQVAERQKEAMHMVMNHEAESVLICMHGRAMRILLCWLLSYPLNFMDGFPHQNCSYYKLIQLKDSFIITEFNQTSHLQ